MPLPFCIALVALTHELNRADCGYQVHKTEREVRHLFYVNDFKQLVKAEDGLENEIKIVEAIGKDINTNFVLKNVETRDNNVAYSAIVYQLLILGCGEITLDIFRQKQQVATSCEVTSVAERDRTQFNKTPISLY